MPGVHWVGGDLAAPGALCDGADAVIHIAGTINALDRAGFDAGNVAGTASLVAAAQAAGIKRFVHVSSLAAREPGVSGYGASKAAAEDVVRASGLDAAIVRPPGVYGPGDRATLPIFKLAARGFAIVPGPGRSSWLEAGDLAGVLLRVAASDYNGLVEVDDGHGGYTHADFAIAVGAALGRRPRLIRPSLGLLHAAAAIDTGVARLLGRLPTLTRGRVDTFAHPDWVADPTRALPRSLRGTPAALGPGLAGTVAWYRRHGWLR